jgi:hypothetical protein
VRTQVVRWFGPTLLAVALATAVAPAAGDRVRLDRLGCPLYAPATDTYACVDFTLESDDVGSADVSRRPDVTRWVQRRPAAWGGHRAIALVSADSLHDDGVTLLAVAQRDYARRARLRRPRTLARALAEAAAAGYTQPVPHRADLPSGTWIAFAGVHLRFETSDHEGDASAYAIGSLRVRCSPPAGPSDTTGAELLGAHRRGARAAAFHATGAPTFAISLLETGGGEGSGYARTRTLLVHRDRACQPATP